MFAKLLETVTGLDELERLAGKDDKTRLNAYLRTRTLWVPIKPTRFLDAANHTEEQLLILVEQGAKDMAGDQFDLWIIDLDGKNVLPVFSSPQRMEAFSGKMSQNLNKIFSFGAIEVLLENAVGNLNIDSIILNPFNKKSWVLECEQT